MANEAISMVSIDNSKNTISLNVDDLRLIFARDDVKDKYVSIISISGPYRQGKSFLLNFFLRYLRVKYAEKREIGDWLSQDDGKLKGFQWASGSKRHTMGILIWPEVFYAKMSTGEEVAIFLMDTQGSFDNNSSMDECAKIFALSTLISSVQIYNLMRNVKQYDFGHLQCFGGYGNLLTNAGHLSPFQDLCILVRDWPFKHEHPYGDMGGHAYLQEIFQTNTEQFKADLENVKSLFDRITCFLLPYPGRAVDGLTNFDGDLEDIDEDFKQHVQDLVTRFLSVDNLVLKTINGEKLKAGEFLGFIEEYGRIFREGDLPKVETFFQATMQAHYKTVQSKAFYIYKKNMDALVKFSVKTYNDTELYNVHHKYKNVAISEYKNMKKYKDDEIFDKYLIQLEDKMDKEFHKYSTINTENIRRLEKRRREAEESRRKIEKRVQEFKQQSQGASTSSANMPSAETIGTAAVVVGAIAAAGFGLFKAFSSNNKD